MAVSKQKYADVVDLIIDNLEGGYYHPDMLLDGRLKDPKGLMSAGEGRQASGETMFGLDRVNGAGLAKSPSWAKFWKLIDDAGARSTWKWNYKGGSLAPQLKTLTAEIMSPEYERMASAYLSIKARQKVEADDRLLLHFIYATWNGEGFFKKFAATMNDAINGGMKDSEQLVDTAIRSRTDSTNVLIRQGGQHVKTVVENMDSPTKKNVKKIILWSLIGIILVILGLILYRYFVQGKRKTTGLFSPLLRNKKGQA